MSTPPGAVGRTSLLMSAGTLLSRILGFVKMWLLVATIGQYTQGGNAFAQGNQLPNYLYSLTIGGVLTAVLVPQVTQAIRTTADRGQQYVNRISTLALTVFAAITIVFTVGSPWILKLYTAQSWPPALFQLAVAFAYWCVPQVFFYAVYALASGVLNAHRVFLPPMWAPVLNNVIAIAGLIVFQIAYGTAAISADAWTSDRIALLAGSSTLGVIIQALTLVVFWRRTGLTYRPDFHWRHVGLGATFKAAGWILGFVLLSGLQSMIQTKVVSIPAGATGAEHAAYASSAAFENAALLYMLPHSIAAVSLATIYFTRFSEHYTNRAFRSFRSDFSAGARSIGIITVIATFGLIVCATPLAALFNRDHAQILNFAYILIALAPSLPFMSLSFLSTRAMYGLNDTRTPFFIQVGKLIWCIPLYAVISIFAPRWIAVSAAGVIFLMCAWDAVALSIVVRRRIGGIDGAHVLRSHVQYTVAAIAAAIPGTLLMWLFGGFHDGGWILSSTLAAMLGVVTTGFVMLALYWIMLRLLRVDEITQVTDQLAHKLKLRR